MKKFDKLLITSPSFCKDPQLVTKVSSLAHKLVLNSDGERWMEKDLIRIFAEQNIDAAIVGTEKLTKEVIAASSTLRVVSKYGVGLDNVDQEALSAKNIPFYYSSGINKRSVSELVLAFALGHSRNVTNSIARMSQGLWIKHGGSTLTGKTIGIVGLGHIGQDLAKLLSIFDCEILYYDIERRLSLESSKLRFTTYEELLLKADIITFHVPSTGLTRNMLARKELEGVKNTVLIINTARGDICNFDDVRDAVLSKKISGFASDVFLDEPFDTSSYKIEDGFYFTPHIGGNASEAIRAMGEAAILGLTTFINEQM